MTFPGVKAVSLHSAEQILKRTPWSAYQKWLLWNIWFRGRGESSHQSRDIWFTMFDTVFTAATIRIVRESELMEKRQRKTLAFLGFGVSRRDNPSMAQTDLGLTESMCWQWLRMFVINSTWEGIQQSCSVPSLSLIFSAKQIVARSSRCNKHNLSLSLCFPVPFSLWWQRKQPTSGVCSKLNLL